MPTREVRTGAESAEVSLPEGPAEALPYEKPRIIWEEKVDVQTNLAIACGKQPGASYICNGAPRTS